MFPIIKDQYDENSIITTIGASAHAAAFLLRLITETCCIDTPVITVASLLLPLHLRLFQYYIPG